MLDRTRSHAEVLTTIAHCGRASPSWQTGKLGVVWEDAGRPATALITPGNIVAGSFAVEYAAGQAADEIAVRYIEPDLDWQYNTLRRLVPGVNGPPAATTTITLEGVTSAEHAAIACNLQAARQLYHRRRLSWEMAAEGLAIARGDVVHITHSLIDGGAAGRLAGGTAAHVILDRAVDLRAPSGATFSRAPSGATYSRAPSSATTPGAGAEMLFRLPDGTLHRSAVSAAGGAQGETAEIALDDPLPEAPGAQGASPLDTLWRLYDASLPPVRARITAVEPATDRRVRFTAIDEVEAYHAAATADLSAPLPVLSRPCASGAGYRFRRGPGARRRRLCGRDRRRAHHGRRLARRYRAGIRRRRPAPHRRPASWTARRPRNGSRLPPALSPLTVTPGTEAAPAGAPFTARYEIVGSLAPPAVPTNFLIDVLGDGTRRLRWQPPADVDLAGVLIRYGAAAGTPLGWDRLTPLHRGHLTASPLETVEPPSGTWVFAARAIDTGGRLSTGDVRIVAELGPQRQGDALLWRCPSAAGWPGRLTDIERSDDGHDALEGAGDYTWDDLTTWDAWQSWGAGNGTGAAAEIAFAAEPVDLGIAFDVALRWSAEIEGDAAFEYRAGASAAAVAAASWAAYAEGTTVAGRWLQLRWRVSGDGSRVLSLDHLCWSVHAPSAERKLLDRNTAEWQGTAATGRIVPTDLRFVTDLDITLQSVGAGWSWTLLSKNNPTRIRIYDGDGNPADAVVDAVVRGVAT